MKSKRSDLIHTVPLHAAQDWPKDLFCGNAHVIFDISKQCWLNKKSLISLSFACVAAHAVDLDMSEHGMAWHAAADSGHEFDSALR